MAIKVINHHNVQSTYRERNDCTYKSESTVTRPEKQTEQQHIANLQQQICNAVPLRQNAIRHRQRHTTQENIKYGKRGHTRNNQKFLHIKQLQNHWHEHDKQHKERRNDERTDIYLLIDGVVHTQSVAIDSRQSWEIIRL